MSGENVTREGTAKINGVTYKLTDEQIDRILGDIDDTKENLNEGMRELNTSISEMRHVLDDLDLSSGLDNLWYSKKTTTSTKTTSSKTSDKKENTSNESTKQPA